jgi:hypothetical protein
MVWYIIMDFRDDLAVNILLFGEEEALDNITIGMIKQDNIECCVCLNFHWGVKLPNCSHFICPKCYYKIYNGYISCDFHSKNTEPKYPVEPIYPYKNLDKNKEIFYSITNDTAYLEWFIDENEDLYNSVKINSNFIANIDDKLKFWFENNDLIKRYENDLIKYENELDNISIEMEEYNELYEQNKIDNSQSLCPLCRK